MKQYKDRDWLCQKYINEKLLMREIGKLLNTSKATISYWIKKFNIQQTKPKYQNRNWLYQKYITEQLSSSKIAKICGVTQPLILRWIKKFKIKSRTPSKAGLIWWKQNPNAYSGKNNPMYGRFPWNKGITAKDDNRILTGRNNPMFGVHRCREKSPSWKGGLTEENLLIRGSHEFREWREKVFKRDNYTCVRCLDDKGGNLNAHHILEFALFPEERFELSNGATLCEECHRYVQYKELR